MRNAKSEGRHARILSLGKHLYAVKVRNPGDYTGKHRKEA